MKHVKAVLEGMGIEKRAGLGLRNGSGRLAVFAIVGSAASHGECAGYVLEIGG